MAALRTTLIRLSTGIAVATFCLTTPLQLAAQKDDAAAMDKLLGPIALYPDPLLAQVLTCSTSPQQVQEFNTWIGKQTVKGSDLQKAAMDAGFEASFASMALFPEVVSTLASNADWTKELGTAYLSDADAVMASVQRLRKQAQSVGTLKTTEQQTVTVESGTQTIVVQPANPQVVYVPVYDPQVVYAAPPPEPPSSGNAALAGLIGFGIGIAIGAAIDDDPYYYGPYGWGAWNMGWHGGGIHYRSAAWVVPVRPRYPYVRPVPAYRPSTTVVAPRRTNVNINVDNSRVNVGNQVNSGNRNTTVNNRNTNVKGNTNVSKGNTNVNDRTPNANTRNANTGNRSTTAGTRAPTATATPNANAAKKTAAADRGHAAPSTHAREEAGIEWDRHERLRQRVEYARGQQPRQGIRCEEQEQRGRSEAVRLASIGQVPLRRRLDMRTRSWRLLALLGTTLTLGSCSRTVKDQSAQRTFPTPDAAAQALARAVSGNDTTALIAIMGPDSRALIMSSDQVQAARDRQVVAVAMAERWWLEEADSASRTLVIGNEAWPFPIPIVHANGEWRFDTAAGKDELLYRRIGANESAVMEVAYAFVEAQREYAAKGRDGKAKGVYAQRFVSEPGRHDGLYWPVTTTDTAMSPMGELAAKAAADGYKRSDSGPTAYHGYYFKVLTARERMHPVERARTWRTVRCVAGLP